MSQFIPQPAPNPLQAILAAHAASQPAPAAPAQESPQVAQQEIGIIKQMIELGNRYQQIQPDAEHKATMAKLLATLHQYLATEQKDAEAALGGGAPTRLLRRIGNR